MSSLSPAFAAATPLLFSTQCHTPLLAPIRTRLPHPSRPRFAPVAKFQSSDPTPPPPSHSHSSSIDDPVSSSPSSSSPSTRRASVVGGPFSGQFGTWYLTQGDVDEVWVYRGLLLLTSLQVCTLVLLADMNVHDLPFILSSSDPASIYDMLAVGASISFGFSLRFIHIYVKPLHDLLKVCWALGMVGVALCQLSPVYSLSVATVHHPVSLLATGGVLIALTGVFVKEGFCFRKGPAVSLAVLTPILAGGHFLNLFRLLSQYGINVEMPLVNLFAVLFATFAAQKLTQEPSDDVGDKSVFAHLAQQEREKRAEKKIRQ